MNGAKVAFDLIFSRADFFFHPNFIVLLLTGQVDELRRLSTASN